MCGLIDVDRNGLVRQVRPSSLGIGRTVLVGRRGRRSCDDDAIHGPYLMSRQVYLVDKCKRIIRKCMYIVSFLFSLSCFFYRHGDWLTTFVRLVIYSRFMRGVKWRVGSHLDSSRALRNSSAPRPKRKSWEREHSAITRVINPYRLTNLSQSLSLSTWRTRAWIKIEMHARQHEIRRIGSRATCSSRVWALWKLLLKYSYVCFVVPRVSIRSDEITSLSLLVASPWSCVRFAVVQREWKVSYSHGQVEGCQTNRP